MADVYERITATILDQLQTASPGSWICPWHQARGGLPRNAGTGRAYRGINILSLWCAAQAEGYASSSWATYRQWEQLGAQVRKGERGSLVLFFKEVAAAEDDDAERPDRRLIARASYAFNIAQVDGASAEDRPEPLASDPTPIFNTFVDATGATVRFGQETACYVPATDEIRMPDRSRFSSAGGYQGTLAHELIHWTGATGRLDRDLTTRFGTKAYAAEELVAELGAAFVLATFGLAPEPHPQHAHYMAAWLPLLRSDSRTLFTAASAASRATDFLITSAEPASAAPPTTPIRRSVRSSRPSRRSPRHHGSLSGSRVHLHGW